MMFYHMRPAGDRPSNYVVSPAKAYILDTQIICLAGVAVVVLSL